LQRNMSETDREAPEALLQQLWHLVES
jgi:hypothetical protein